MVIQKTCKMCGKTQTIKITALQYELWKSGVTIQCAMPELDADTRELMVSGVCGKCFDEMFPDEEEEDEDEESRS